MKAMVLKNICDLTVNKTPLELVEMPEPVPGYREILIKVSCCGVCHTELDEIEGRTPPPRFPIILGHQVVGRVIKSGSGSRNFRIGDRVGVAWICSSCGTCKFCRGGKENLCADFKATGRDAHGGYAEYMTVPEDFAYLIPREFTDSQAAPLLCAGAIGYRSLSLTTMDDGDNLGLTGFGASAHLVLKLAKHIFPKSKIFVFARSEKESATLGDRPIPSYLEFEVFSDLKNADEFMKVFKGGYFEEWECGADLSADTTEAKMKITEGSTTPI